jgi:hypothetical protein
MEGLIKPTIHIDEFTSKMGDDDDIIVISFFVRNPDAAKDLMNWFERGYDWVLDASVSEGELEAGKYLVFVEMNRRSVAPARIVELLKDLKTQFVNVSPGLFLNKAADGNSYNLNVIVNTFDSSINELPLYEQVTIENIPVQKWVCTTIRVQGKIVDIYVNGMLSKRVTLISVPKQNYYDTYIGDTNGFKGYVSSLRYYGYAIGYSEIQALFASGPSLKMIESDAMPASTDYLSINWYFT